MALISIPVIIWRVPRSIFNEEETPESCRTDCDHADGGLDMDPENSPYLVVGAHNAGWNPAEQTNGDHEKA